MKITCFGLLFLFWALPALAIELPLLASAQVTDDQVMLHDLFSPEDALQLDSLIGTVKLFGAPQPGKTRKVSRETLARLIGRQVKTDQLRLSGASSVTISRKGIWIEPVEIESVLIDYLKSVRTDSGVRLSYEKLHLPARFMVPTGKIEHQIIPSSTKVIGSRRVTLITRVNGQVVANQSLRVSIKASARVVVMASDLKRGEILTAALLKVHEQDITNLEEPFFSISPLLGKQLKQSLRFGTPVQKRQVEFPPLIKRGERVTIQARNSGLLLSAVGEARQNGELGETIRVRNKSSQREILCQVLASGLVSVEF